MADIAQLYPPSPTGLPAGLTTSSRSYRARVILVLASLIVFLIVYLGLIVGSAGLAFYCFREGYYGNKEPVTRYAIQPGNYRNGPGSYPVQTMQTQPVARPKSTIPPFWLFVAGISSSLLFLFLVKGLFQRTQDGGGTRLEVTEKEQPFLFAFIRKLCEETRAPFPHKIFLVPDVNAAVAYHQSVLSLILPTRKNLIIGLGLVNRLNLTEFKAVLAHEFGHFSQKSMKLGGYVYTSNRVVVDIVYGRGKLDQFVAALCQTDIRIAAFAWAFSAILWTIRKFLELLFRGIYFAHTSLSRQMEYNADLVAVSVTGSDALVFALARLDFASDSLEQGWADLMTSAEHNRFSRDLYFHQTRAAEYLRRRRNDPALGEVPPLPDDPLQTVQVFKPEDVTVPKMWATHPSNHNREMNAKARYCRGITDDRPAWDLFANQAKVRERMTRMIYASLPRKLPDLFEEPEAVQEFIDAEHAETTYHPRYHGLYDDRYIKPGDPADLFTRSMREEFDNPGRLAQAYSHLYDESLKSRMDTHKSRQEEIVRLRRIADGVVQLTGKEFEHRGRQFRFTQVSGLLKEVEKEIDKDFENMHVLDRLAFRIHYSMAAQLGEGERTELEERYRFHLAVQEIHSTLRGHATYLDSKKGLDAAVSHFKELVSAYPKSQGIRDGAYAVAERAVRRLEKDKKFAEALQTLTKYQALAGERTPNLRVNVFDDWARSLAAEGAWQAALNKYADGLAAEPKSTLLRDNAILTADRWAFKAIDKKDWDEAIQRYDTGLKLVPGAQRLKNNRAYCVAQREKK